MAAGTETEHACSMLHCVLHLFLNLKQWTKLETENSDGMYFRSSNASVCPGSTYNSVIWMVSEIPLNLWTTIILLKYFYSLFFLQRHILLHYHDYPNNFFPKGHVPTLPFQDLFSDRLLPVAIDETSFQLSFTYLFLKTKWVLNRQLNPFLHKIISQIAQ